MELRIYPSDEQFAEVSFLAEWIARLKNPHMFFDLAEMDSSERLAVLEKMERMFEELTH